jgi:hypothetical protein
MKRDIHSHDRRLKNSLNRLESSSMPESSKKAVYDFHFDCFADGLGKPRVVKYLNHLSHLGEKTILCVLL